MSAVQIPKWKIKADYVETCNCNYGCPCNFNGFPSFGFCRAMDLFHIRDGSYGNVVLDGIDVILAASWPKAIHEGNGTGQLFISNKAKDDQRKAAVNIFSGKAKGEGPFTIFASTIKYELKLLSLSISKLRLTAERAAFLCLA